MALYTGLGFPTQISYQGIFPIREDKELVTDSIRQIIGTQPGERRMHPEFGCNLRPILFEKNDPDGVTKRLIAFRVLEAVRRWEPRVVIREVTFIDSPEIREQSQVLMRLLVELVATGETFPTTFKLSRSQT